MKSAYTLLVGVLAGILYGGTSNAAAPLLRTQAPGFYRRMIDELEITAILDGTHPFPVHEVMTRNEMAADGSRTTVKLLDPYPGEAECLLAEDRLAAPIEGLVNAFLVNTGKKLVLIDSGAGSLYGTCCGHLIENLLAAGFKPEQIDEIYLTHLHADHVGGVAPHGSACGRRPDHSEGISGGQCPTPLTERLASGATTRRRDGKLSSIEFMRKVAACRPALPRWARERAWPAVRQTTCIAVGRE